MLVFDMTTEQEWNPHHHVEKILGKLGGGDVTIACWEPGQISPYHSHPDATEMYLCLSGGGTMRTPETTIPIVPGGLVVHPPGELHEYANGPARTVLFRVRYGRDMAARHFDWRDNAAFVQSAEDAAYFRANPPIRTEPVTASA
ncbi:MAG: cupin domain-containing protein [Rhodoplanes sp.]|uniref:cupin domain-containing protein n=1 Tax=Rhodoplanes sp. TaxID=1968906 RepID=UPI0017C275DB|nr:cupin domain-containing protein [Rhodoplanes sp.]NVO12773.1 cupin domain-containing protein [Rhodoplanes sp.]